MGENSGSLHEDPEVLGGGVVDRHRAIASIMEELEAVDWYDQRVAATTDQSLAAVLAHSRDEEKEHASMTLEWLRRHDPELDEALRQYLFTDGSIVALEHEVTGDGGGGGGGGGGGRAGGSLGIGSLREGKEYL
jgi:ferritin-like protein